jgi:hypothetical protein
MQLCPGQIRSAKICPRQHRARQVGAMKLRIA